MAPNEETASGRSAIETLADADRQRCRGALEAAFGQPLPHEALDILLDGARQVRLPIGQVVREQHQRAPLSLVLEGLLRLYLSAPDGRQVTIRYFRPGEFIGLSTALGSGGPLAGVQTLTETCLLQLRGGSLEALEQVSPALGWAVARLVARTIGRHVVELQIVSFGSVQQRIVRHLFDIAAADQQGGRLVARVSHQSLADAAGSVREVVSRTLRDLRREGLLESVPDGIALLDPDRLAALLHDVD
jgi:CRP/FNR family transcriptional regulator, cyclic AMP receptor protein